MGADVVSFFFSGKTVADLGISMAMDEDCAMIGVLEGEICDDQPDYQNANIQVALAPLPSPFDGEALASADAQVLASAQRAALVFGDSEPASDGLDGGFPADNTAVAGTVSANDSLANLRPRQRPADLGQVARAVEPATSVPLPARKPIVETAPEPLFAGGFLVDAAVVPGGEEVVVLQVASIAPAAGAAPETPSDESDAVPAKISEGVAPAVSALPTWQAKRPNAKRSVLARARTVRPTAAKRPVLTGQRFTASRVTSEVGRAPLVQVAFELPRGDRRLLAEPYAGPASPDMGR